MNSTAPDSGDGLPIAGPEESRYDRYRFDTTTDGEALIYDDQLTEAWVQAAISVSLEAWR